nr:rhodanese-like domain-containing protein [Idiomarina xiamenensis]
MMNPQQLCQAAQDNVQQVSIEQLRAALADGQRLIDVREPAEFSSGHIADAVNMPRGVLEMQLAQHPDVAGYDDALQRMAKDPLYLICRSGGRSALAAESLQRMGFKQVYSVSGGMSAWQQAELPQVTE